MNTQVHKETPKPVIHKPLTIIAGPCSAETEEQVMNIAQSLAATGRIDMFRVGIWKPRTRPGCFEGVGTEGLKWLQQVRQVYGLPCATEVATPYHVYEALKYGVDTLWIGARTTTNPFAVQELAEALRGSGIRVMIKNPVPPDVELWTGATERLLNAGIDLLSLVHRGFAAHGKKNYRNEPYWEVAGAMRSRFPCLPLICDPSHMGGDRKYLYELSAKAIALAYDGLMIEAHANPAAAWSDAAQQVTAAELSVLLRELAIDTSQGGTLPVLRSEIDVIDDRLLDILTQRMHIVQKIGALKRQEQQPVLQADRWREIIGRLTGKAGEKGLSTVLIENVFTAIHNESLQQQLRIPE